MRYGRYEKREWKGKRNIMHEAEESIGMELKEHMHKMHKHDNLIMAVAKGKRTKM